MVEEEFELLTERDFYNTEWKIGTLMDDKPRDAKSIDTTAANSNSKHAHARTGSRCVWSVLFKLQYRINILRKASIAHSYFLFN